MGPVDPCTVLGLPVGSSIDDARAARRRLAKQLHPDLHGRASAEQRAAMAARMALINQAVTEVEAGDADPAPPARGSRHTDPDGPHPAAAAIDAETFAVGCLPAEAFEALFLVAYGIGDILEADEPYRLELYLTDPAPCFCQLTLVPEAGGSIVMLDVSPPADADAGPPAASVRDVFVSELNRLAIT